ncbi:MAG: hypothetical protein FD121_1091 [Gallionellaceae bacterium]|nr:MAG: hypothetical protein FD121_1091 [Gallionellaceae bacterium]
MFLEGKDYLSIWEVSHRWAGLDPDSTDPDNLPEEVRYFIHKMVEGYLGEELKLRKKDGYRVIRDPLHILIWSINFDLHYMWSCLTKNNFNKRKLSDLYVRRREVINLCKLEEIEPPTFWIKQRPPETTTKANVTNRPKEEEVDRLLCQAIAGSLWMLDPNIHPAHMVKSKAIQHFGQGRSYKDLNTIKRWLAEVDPIKNRNPGRPPVVTYKIDLEMDPRLED